jgi:uncharacterized repeat protein (TIGR03803 family)
MTEAMAYLDRGPLIRQRAIRCVLVLAITLAQIVIASGQADAQEPATFTTLYSFKGGASGDGAFPLAGLIRDGAGNLYGTTGAGGRGYGTVFKLDTAGVETVLYRFRGGTDGLAPDGLLVFDPAGNLYGATVNGGGTYTCAAYGCGTVFMLDPTGTETVLHRFGGSEGTLPFGGVVRDGSGNLYGTAALGGAGLGNCGTVFKVDATGTAALYSFLGGTDGCVPESDLVRDAEGNFYGTTTGSGAPGTVFKVDPTGMETVLYDFLGGTDGEGPFAGLVRDAAGNLYGTTMSGSGSAAYGTVFKVDTTGRETVLHAFAGPPDGAYPMAELVLDGAGNLYGTTTQGGSGFPKNGIVFRVDPAGTETVLHSFNGTDGATPMAGLLLDAAGSLYGTTRSGGAFGFGTVFKISH